MWRLDILNMSFNLRKDKPTVEPGKNLEPAKEPMPNPKGEFDQRTASFVPKSEEFAENVVFEPSQEAPPVIPAREIAPASSKDVDPSKYMITTKYL